MDLHVTFAVLRSVLQLNRDSACPGLQRDCGAAKGWLPCERMVATGLFRAVAIVAARPRQVEQGQRKVPVFVFKPQRLR